MKISDEFQVLLERYLTKLLQPKSANIDVKTFIALVMMDISNFEPQALPPKLESLKEFLKKDADEVVRHIMQLVDLMVTNPDGFRLHLTKFLDSKSKSDVSDASHDKLAHRLVDAPNSSKYRRRGDVDQRFYSNNNEQHYENSRYESSRYADASKSSNHRSSTHRDLVKDKFEPRRHNSHKEFYEGQSEYNRDNSYEGQKVSKNTHDDHHFSDRSRHDRSRSSSFPKEQFLTKESSRSEHSNSSSYKHSRDPYYSRGSHGSRSEFSRDTHSSRDSHGSRSGDSYYRSNDSVYESHPSHNDMSRDSHREPYSRERDRDRSHFVSRNNSDSHSNYSSRDHHSSHHDASAASSNHSSVESDPKKNPLYNKPPAQPILFLSLVPQHLNDINFLNDYFRHFGKVVNIETRPRGHALIKFEKYSAAEAALKSGTSICGDPNIRISWWNAEMDRFGARQAAFSQVPATPNASQKSNNSNDQHRESSDSNKDIRDTEKTKKSSPSQRDDDLSSKHTEKSMGLDESDANKIVDLKDDDKARTQTSSTSDHSKDKMQNALEMFAQVPDEVANYENATSVLSSHHTPTSTPPLSTSLSSQSVHS